MFCGKCGTQNPDNAKFCASCGAPMSAIPAPEAASSASKNTNRKVGIIAVGVCALLVLILLFTLFSGRSAEETAVAAVDAILTGNVKEFVQLLPPCAHNYAIEEYGQSLDEAIEEKFSEFSSEMEWLNIFLGDKVNISCEAVDSEELSDTELRELKREYRKWDDKVTAAKIVYINTDLSFVDSEVEIPVVKIGTNWYLDISKLN